MNNHNEEGNCTNEERKLSFTWPDITSAFIICIPSTIGRGNPTSAISKKKTHANQIIAETHKG